jgi:hypothetical protein
MYELRTCTRREIREFNDSGELDGSRRNGFSLFQLDQSVIGIDELGIGALDLDIVCNGVSDDYRAENRTHTNSGMVGGSDGGRGGVGYS